MTNPTELLLLANRDAQDRLGLARTDDPWAGSPFEWIRKIIAPRTRGKAGELLAEAWLLRLGLPVAPPSNTGHDRLVAQRRVEIKFSTPWRRSPRQPEYFKFQQIRDQDYEVALLLGLTPIRAQIWLVPKGELYHRATGQHGGAQSVVRWLSFPPESPPDWLQPFGGELEKAEAVVRSWFSI